MKTKLLLSIFTLLLSLEMVAQPQSFKYQAVVRNGAGQILSNQTVSIRATIHQSTAGGTVVYRETFATTTNQFGIVNLNIGSGTIVSGKFTSILWGSYDHFLQIEVDVTGGSAYADMGTTQLLSVPYALYAKESNNSSISDSAHITRVTTENTASENTIRFFTNGSEKLRITPKGNIESTQNSIYIGNGAGKNNATTYNVIIGDSAAAMANSMTSSVGIGYRALYANSTGDYNAVLGAMAMSNNTTGNRNTAIGRAALMNNTTGSYNSSLGYYSLSANTTGNFNIGLGYNAMSNNTISSNSIAIGGYALYSHTGFVGADSSNNIAIGNYALYMNNPTLGTNARDNVAIGNYSLQNNTIGYSNMAVGTFSMRSNTTGNYNTAFGSISLNGNKTGNYNTAMGRRAGEVNDGDYNVYLGYDAGNTNTTGSMNTYLGASSYGLPTITNSTAIGYATYISTSNTVKIGNTSVTTIGGPVAWSIISDYRLKENIRYTRDLGLNFIMKLQSASYNYTEDPAKTRHDGFIAQDVEKAMKELGLDFDGLIIEKDAQGTHRLAYSQFVIPLINSVQELEVKNRDLEKKTRELEDLATELIKQNKELLKRLEKLEKN